jgi:hypothetical protein
MKPFLGFWSLRSAQSFWGQSQNSPRLRLAQRGVAQSAECRNTAKAKVHSQHVLARAVIAEHPLRALAGATSPDGQVIVVRVVAPVVEPAMDLLRRVWTVWRAHFWKISAQVPRIWST